MESPIKKRTGSYLKFFLVGIVIFSIILATLYMFLGTTLVTVYKSICHSGLAVRPSSQQAWRLSALGIPEPKRFRTNMDTVYVAKSEPIPLDRVGNFAKDNVTGLHYILDRCSKARFIDHGIGNIIRPVDLDGELSYEEEPVEPLHIYYRFSPRTWKKTLPVLRPDLTVVLSIVSLRNSLAVLSETQKQSTALHILFSGFNENANDYSATGGGTMDKWIDWMKKHMKQHVKRLNITKFAGNSNAASFECMVAEMEKVKDPEAIIFFLEDDYLNHPDMLSSLVEVFHTYEHVCMAVPYDYYDLYDHPNEGFVPGDSSNQSIIIASRTEHWRSIDTVTVTFAGRRGFFHALMLQPPFVANGGELSNLVAPWADYDLSRRITRDFDVSIFAPIPSKAAHVQQLEYLDGKVNVFNWYPRLPLYFDYNDFARSILEQAKTMSVPAVI